MAIRYDADEFRLRLDRDSFEALVAWCAGPDAGFGPEDPARVTALREAGVLGEGDLPHPVVHQRVEAVADPICRLVVRMRDHQGRAEGGDGWVGGGITALLLDLPDGLAELTSVHPTFLPAALAKIVELRPRPRLAGDPVPAAPELVSQLTDPDRGRQAAAVAELAPGGVVTPHRDWRVELTWPPAADSAGVRAFRVLDTPAGLWLVEPHADQLRLSPTTPTAVWRRLVRLLPADHELS